MTEEITLKEVEVQKLRLRPGDVLVFTLPHETKHSWMQKFAMYVQRVLPRNPALIVCGNLTISIASQEEAEKLKKGTQDGREA